MGDHRTARPARWPRALVLAVAVAYVVVLVTHGRTAPEPDRVPLAPTSSPTPSSSSCVPATTTYPDGSRWHKCADETPPPAVLPPSDPFNEE